MENKNINNDLDEALNKMVKMLKKVNKKAKRQLLNWDLINNINWN